MDPSQTLIELQNVSFGYRGIPVLKGLTLSVGAGDFVGIVGANGAGKSTFLRGLAGLLPPLAGRVVRSPSLAGRIGYVPQRAALDSIFPLTVRDVVLMGRLGHQPWYHLPGREDRRRVDAALSDVGLAPEADRPYSELSEGQRQRALVARALAADPLLLILDEPTAGVDREAEEKILELLAELSGKKNMSLLMVSHRIEGFRGRARHLFHIGNQQVTWEATPSEMRSGTTGGSA